MPKAEWRAEAEAELAALPRTEQLSIGRAATKLEALGSQLPFPHQSAVRGTTGLREVRPKSGGSSRRAFYRRIAPEVFKIGAVGPEYLVNRKGFDRSICLAEQRLSEFEEYEGVTMAYKESKTTGEVMEGLVERDPKLRQEWERTALARAVAIEIIRYRAENDVSQAELAKRLNIHQPAIAMLEEGEHNPSIAILRRLSEKLGVNMTINIHSGGVDVEPLTKESA